MSEGTTLAAAIRALAAQYRDLAIAEELDHIAIKADQYPEMPATGRMQRALWDAEEVLLQRLADIQTGVSDIRASVAAIHVEQAELSVRDARQYAESAQDRVALNAQIDALRARLDRIEQSLVGRETLVEQHYNHEARITALEHRSTDADAGD